MVWSASCDTVPSAAAAVCSASESAVRSGPLYTAVIPCHRYTCLLETAAFFLFASPTSYTLPSPIPSFAFSTFTRTLKAPPPPPLLHIILIVLLFARLQRKEKRYNCMR